MKSKLETAVGKGLIKNQALRAGILALAMALLIPATGSRAAEGDSNLFKFYKLDLSGTRHDRVFADFNGDKVLDLGMVFSRSDKPDNYWFRACLQDKAGGFRTCPEVTLPKEARAFDVGELDGKPGAEMALITRSGVSLSSFSGTGFGAFKQIISDQNILSNTDSECPALLHCLWDLNNDGKQELVVPTTKGPAIYAFNGTAFTLFQQINSPAFITYRVGSLGDIAHTDDINQFLAWQQYEKRATAHYTAPDVFFADFNADKKPDIATLVDNTLRVFPQGADGKFANSPVLTFKREILSPQEKGVSFAGEGMTIADLNGDGLADIIMMKWGGSQERTQMDRYLYYAQPGFKYPDKPDQIVRSESAAVDFGIHDMNKDGKQDLIIPFFHFAPAQAFKVMTENAVKVQFRLFLMTPQGRYSTEGGNIYAKVDRRILLNYKIDVLGLIFDFKTLIEGKFHPLLNFGHDFNGDGYSDLVADTGGDKLTFYWGNAPVNYAAQPNASIDFESAQDYDLVDLNGDKKCDVITYYDSAARTQKKRELAQKAHQEGQVAPEPTAEEAALALAPEGTRIKFLISK